MTRLLVRGKGLVPVAMWWTRSTGTAGTRIMRFAKPSRPARTAKVGEAPAGRRRALRADSDEHNAIGGLTDEQWDGAA